jgi:hypothetical protein
MIGTRKGGLLAVIIMNMGISGTAFAGEITGFDFPVKTYKNDGALDSYVLTKGSISVPIDSVEIVAVRPSYKLIQIKVDDDYFNVRVEKVKFRNPGQYSNLGKGVSWICPGAGSRQSQPGGRSYSTRGLGVEPICL